MKASSLVRLLALPAVIAILAGLVGFGAVRTYSHRQPDLFAARVTAFVEPVTKAGAGVDAAYPTISSANLPALAEYVHSPGVLDAVKAAVPGAPDAATIGAGMSIDPIPASTVVRFTVSDGDEKMASRLATALSTEIEKADLFGSIARLRVVDAEKPVTTQVSPDKKLGTGLALLVGMLLAVSAAALWLMFLPRIIFRSQIKRIVDDGRTAVFDATTPDKAARSLSVLSNTDGVEVVALGPNRRVTTAAVSDAIDERLVSTDPAAPVLMALPRGSVSPRELTAALGIAEGSGRNVLGVALV